MSWNRTVTLTLDVDAPYGRVLMGSLNDTSLLNQPPVHVLGDAFPIRLQFARRSAVPTEPATGVSPPPGSSIVYCAKAAGGGGDLLFFADGFAPVLGDDSNPIPGLYQSTLNLNTTQLADHLAASPTGAKLLLGEVEVRNAAATERLSLQFDLIARPQVYVGTEGVPIDSTPPYPSPSSILVQDQLGSIIPSLRLDISTLTGGGPTALDGITTVGLSLPRMVMLVLPGNPLSVYVLEAGTAPESSPATIRPDDYHPTTNAKVWQRKL